MNNMKKFFSILVLITLFSCNENTLDPDCLGDVTYIPPGHYFVKNYASRHGLRVYREDGKYYRINDHNFRPYGYFQDTHNYMEGHYVDVD